MTQQSTRFRQEVPGRTDRRGHSLAAERLCSITRAPRGSLRQNLGPLLCWHRRPPRAEAGFQNGVIIVPSSDVSYQCTEYDDGFDLSVCAVEVPASVATEAFKKSVDQSHKIVATRSKIHAAAKQYQSMIQMDDLGPKKIAGLVTVAEQIGLWHSDHSGMETEGHFDDYPISTTDACPVEALQNTVTRVQGQVCNLASMSA